MKHTASARFWRCYDSLPTQVRAIADKNFNLLKSNSSHPSLQFKMVGGGKLYTVRIGIHHRALGLPRQDGVHWFWIGTHSEYDRLIDA